MSKCDAYEPAQLVLAKMFIRVGLLLWDFEQGDPEEWIRLNIKVVKSPRREVAISTQACEGKQQMLTLSGNKRNIAVHVTTSMANFERMPRSSLRVHMLDIPYVTTAGNTIDDAMFDIYRAVREVWADD